MVNVYYDVDSGYVQKNFGLFVGQKFYRYDQI